MKKVKFLKRIRATVINEHGFETCEGYLDIVINPKNLMETIKIVYSKNEYGWYSTHFDSGLQIISLSSTKKECIEQTLKRIEAVFVLIHKPEIQKMIEEANFYRNKIITDGF